MHDYYDFQLYRADKIKKVVDTIYDGTYQPSRPSRIRKEKQNGIVRHLVVLRPEDALILEALGVHLYAFVNQASQSKNAFFSQKHKKNSTIEEIHHHDDSSPMQWWELWPLFQNKICNFSKVNDYLVITDIATYYDSIDLRSLRNSISSAGHFSEGFLDFLFFMVEHFAWRPDYIPYSGKGLAQMNIEAVRVLAHAYLFDVDSYLERKVPANFVRWMDDIDFGVASKLEGKKILQALDEILLSKGLHLNSSKTKILNSEEAERHFFFTENMFLSHLANNMDLTLKRKKLYIQKKKIFREKFRLFLAEERKGNSEKIIKRYLSLSSKFNYRCSPDILNMFLQAPALRQSVFNYLSQIGWSESYQKLVESLIFEAIDDEGLLLAIRLLLIWKSSSPTKYRFKMVKIAESLVQFPHTMEQSQLLCSLWLRCKFSSPKNLSDFIIKVLPIWKTKPWLARQFAAAWPLLDQRNKEFVENAIYINGLSDARAVVENLKKIHEPEQFIVKNIVPYLKAFSRNDVYPLHKAILARTFLKGNAPIPSKNVVNEAVNKISDLHIKRLIKFDIK